MKKYNEIQGWFDYQSTFDFLVASVPDSGIFVECGAWLGSSSSYLCDIANNRINIYIVDTWLGSPNELNSSHKLATEKNIYEIFLDNMGDRSFIPLRMDSCEAAQKFEDNSCDVIYIDMTHTYDAVKRDIECWVPKVKPGGYIAGHDYSCPDVSKAVNDSLKDIILMDSSCWIVKK